MTKGKKAIIFRSGVPTGVDGRSSGSVIACGSKENIPVAGKLVVTLLCVMAEDEARLIHDKSVFCYQLTSCLCRIFL